MISDIKKLSEEIINNYNINDCKGFKNEINDAISKSVRYEYSSYRERGDGYGGFYNPNWGDFLVVGGYKKGKLLSHHKTPKKYGYQYGFDEMGRLTFDHNCFENGKQLFDDYGIYKYEGNSIYVVRGAIISGHIFIKAWSKAVYNRNKIIEYYLYEGLITDSVSKNKKIFLLHHCSYTYSKDEIVYIRKTYLSQYKSTYELYRFILDENQKILFYFDDKGNKYII